MITNVSLLVLFCSLAGIGIFTYWSINSRRKELLYNLFLTSALISAAWIVPLIGIRFTNPDNTRMLYILDALTNFGCAFIPVICLLTIATFTHGWKKLPTGLNLLFIIPVITNIVIWTNPLHHWQYVHFSIIRNEIEFGPYIIFSGMYNYICLMTAVGFLLYFMYTNQSAVYLKQAALMLVGVAVPLAVSLLATFGIVNWSIAATPISFLVTIACCGIAIYKLHITDIRPIATKHLLNRISDGYLIVSSQGLVANYNLPLLNIIGHMCDIQENVYLKDCFKSKNEADTRFLYDLLSAIETSKRDMTTVSYEVTVVLPRDNEYKKFYYFVDVIPLDVDEHYGGSIIIYKDVTQVKSSMQKLHDNHTRMMEQERLAFMGQMAGGLAHNLKTPIMGISGCSVAIEKLVQESYASIGDPEVTKEDYDEIYREMMEWILKIRESCSYMSDIITAIKGQTTNVSASDKGTFTVRELIKRSSILMRHELMINNCQLAIQQEETRDFVLNGDINNLIQVLNNLVSNAIYAQSEKGGGSIVVGVEKKDETLDIYVKDSGVGMNPRVKESLFKEMVTSKGTKGTGLGLYISDAAVKGKFGGTMWAEDNPEGGAIIGFSIPLEKVAEIRFTGGTERA